MIRGISCGDPGKITGLSQSEELNRVFFLEMSILLRYKKNVYQKVLLSKTKYVQISKFTQYTKYERIRNVTLEKF